MNAIKNDVGNQTKNIMKKFKNFQQFAIITVIAILKCFAYSKRKPVLLAEILGILNHTQSFYN